MPLVTTSLKLDADIKERLNKLAIQKRRSANWLMGEAITAFVARAEADAEFDRITRERIAAYDATGEYVSAERADAWLDRLEAGENIPPPKATVNG